MYHVYKTLLPSKQIAALFAFSFLPIMVLTAFSIPGSVTPPPTQWWWAALLTSAAT